MIKLKHLESALAEVDPFENPKIHLEQIPTSPHLAAHMIYAAKNDIQEYSFVGDFGIGTGMLSIACHMMGCNQVTGIDVDPEALDEAWVNIKKLSISEIDLIQADIQHMSFATEFDTVVMNPPFGTRNSGIDTIFVQTAMKNATVTYSLHKTSTRQHFIRLAEEKEW
eukprot:CAMPEP_0182436940 /NCGR_PEP_ID=MMETSP1167-20130531/84562_1 /TAXON_ID=2988 /ORGANISM="Mallomonas Sp, Strain CCMP3275" /LENGTH=166 /DNA_ID=CAMNT_0024629649 /DNA_START=173 /DNA_END=670 /DNA_ORIENTATION=+